MTLDWAGATYRQNEHLGLNSLEPNSAGDERDVESRQLVQHAQAGDRDAFTRLVEIHHRQVLAYIIGMVRSRELADEIAQDVFLAAYQSIDQFAQQSKLSTWLIGIARNKAITALRKEIRQQQRDQQAKLLNQLTIQNLENHTAQQADDQIEALRSCLKKLEPKHQQMLQRHYADNESTATIGAHFGMSASGVRMIFLRLRRSLQECIRNQTNL